MKELGLEVETLEKSLHVSSPLGTRVSVDMICQDCELEISGILLTVDLRVMDMSEFDVILGMDWLTTHRDDTPTHPRDARVYAVTQQDADAALDVVTGIISILDHDAYTLVDLGATHSFASKPFLDRFQIETQPLEGSMRVSFPVGDPLIADRVVRDSRVLIEGHEFPVDLVALDMRDFDVVLGMDWSSRHRATLDCYKKEVKLHRLGKI